MSEKKIAECVKVLINLGNFSNIEIAKYAEKVITYETQEEMVQKEDELTVELVNNIVRNMKKIPEQLGKKTTAPEELTNKMIKAIPEWLTVAPIPNLANSAKKISAETDGKVKGKEDKEWTIETITELPASESSKDIKIEEKETPPVVNDARQDNTKQDNDEDLFGADEDLFK